MKLTIQRRPAERSSPERERPGYRSRNGGFSLVEVLCAILILGVALVGLVEGTTTALLSVKESELQTGAALMAAGVIETLRAEGDLIDGETQGDGGTELPLYRWKRTVRPAGVAGLHEVAVVVEHTKTGKGVYELRTLLFEPAEETAGAAPRKSREPKRKRGAS